MMESQEIPVVNLEYGKPFVADALDRLNEELIFAKQNGTRVVKFIHGYDSAERAAVLKRQFKRSWSCGKTGEIF